MLCSKNIGLVIMDDYFKYTWVLFLQQSLKQHLYSRDLPSKHKNEFDCKIKKLEVTITKICQRVFSRIL